LVGPIGPAGPQGPRGDRGIRGNMDFQFNAVGRGADTDIVVRGADVYRRQAAHTLLSHLSPNQLLRNQLLTLDHKLHLSRLRNRRIKKQSKGTLSKEELFTQVLEGPLLNLNTEDKKNQKTNRIEEERISEDPSPRKHL